MSIGNDPITSAARNVYPTTSSGRATRSVKTVLKNTQKISTAELIAECVSRAKEWAVEWVVEWAVELAVESAVEWAVEWVVE